MNTEVEKTNPLRKRLPIIGIAVAALLLWFGWRYLYPSGLEPTQVLQAQHKILALHFSPDEKWLVAGSQTGEGITLWDASTGQQVRRWRESGDDIRFSRDSVKLLTVDYDFTNKRSRCVLRNLKTASIMREWTEAGRIVTATSDLSLLLTTRDERVFMLTEAATGRKRGNFAKLGPSYSMRFSLDGQYLSAPDRLRPSQLLRVSDLRRVMPLPPLHGFRVSRDSQQVVGVAEKGMLHLWQIPSKQHTLVRTGLTSATWVYDLPDGNLAVSGYEGAASERRDVIQVRSGDGAKLIHSVPAWLSTASWDGRYVANTIFAHKTRLGNRVPPGYEVIELESGKTVARINLFVDRADRSRPNHAFGRSRFAISPSGRKFALAVGTRQLRLYDLDRQQ